MPRNAAPPWRRRKEPILDEHLRASLHRASGVPDPVTGHYAELLYMGCKTRERAQEIRQAFFRAGRYVGVSVDARVERHPDGTWLVRYKAIDKTAARKYTLSKYGPDVSKWPYNPRQRNTP